MREPQSVRRITIHIQIPIRDCRRAAAVLATAAAQFGPEDPVHLIITPDDDTVPSATDAEQLRDFFGGLMPELGPTGIVTLTPRYEVAPGAADLAVTAGHDPAEDARAILTLAAAGRRFGSFLGARLGWTPRGGFAASRAEAICALRQRDIHRAIAGDTSTQEKSIVRVAIVLWSLNFWGAVETFYSALQKEPDAEVEVVYLRSDSTTFRARTELDVLNYFLDRGVQPMDEAWLRARMADLDLVVFPEPYDASRPTGLRVADFASGGVRLVYLPYGAFNTADQSTLNTVNLPLQNLAWRMYVHASGEIATYDAHCQVGAKHARSLGSIKNERLLLSGPEDEAAQKIRATLATDTVTLWNPHWDVSQQGLSSFHQNVAAIINFFRDRPSRGLLVRPHPRLLLDIERAGTEGAKFVAGFRLTCEQMRNVYFDEEWDHLPALKAADSMISDLSSVIPEYLALARPTGYLPPPAGATYTGDQAWRGNVVELDNHAALLNFLDQPFRPAGAQPPTSDVGSGARVVADMISDFRFETGRQVDYTASPAA